LLEEVKETGRDLLYLVAGRGREILDRLADDKLCVEDRFVFHTALYDEEEGDDGYSPSDSFPETTNEDADDKYLIP